MPEETFNKGEKVPQNGEYVCAPCGFKKHFKEGERFPECTSCLAGSEGGSEEFAEGLELWERVRDIPGELDMKQEERR